MRRLFVPLVVLSACTTVKYAPAESGVKRPEKSPGQVQILEKAPDRPYVATGELEARHRTYFGGPDALEQLQKRAAREGCDAVLITGSFGSRTEVFRGGTPFYLYDGYRGQCLVFEPGKGAVGGSGGQR